MSWPHRSHQSSEAFIEICASFESATRRKLRRPATQLLLAPHDLRTSDNDLLHIGTSARRPRAALPNSVFGANLRISAVHRTATPRNGGRGRKTMRTTAFALAFGVLLAAAPSHSHAEDHLTLSIAHTKAAIDAGRQGRPDALAKDADIALRHVEAAQKVRDDEHLQKGAAHLLTAVDLGERRHLEYAMKNAQEALTHLEAAPKSE
jgi:hypothetical protein